MSSAALMNEIHKKKIFNIYGENIKIKSKAIHSVCYHPMSSVLEIFFTSKTHYAFLDVLPDTFAKFMSSKSKGKAFNLLIRDAFKHLELTDKAKKLKK
jgi:hypothetical protein